MQVEIHVTDVYLPNFDREIKFIYIDDVFSTSTVLFLKGLNRMTDLIM